MRIKKYLSIFFACLMVVGMVAGCSPTQAPEETEEGTQAEAPKVTEDDSEKIVIKLSCGFSNTSPVVEALNTASENILKKTDGKVELQVYGNFELASYGDGVEVVRSNAAFMHMASPGEYVDYMPDFPALQGPYLYDSFEHYEKLMDTPVIDKLQAEAEEAGVYVINFAFLEGFRSIMSDRPITKVEDAKGLKIRLPDNRVWTEPFELMGANISTIAWTETYTALQQGIVDAVECSLPYLYDSKVYEVKKIISETKHILGMSCLFVGLDFWNSIPEEYRTVIKEEIDNAAYNSNREFEAQMEDIRGKMIDEGVEFYPVEVEGFKEATKPIMYQYSIGKEMLETLDAIR